MWTVEGSTTGRYGRGTGEFTEFHQGTLATLHSLIEVGIARSLTIPVARKTGCQMARQQYDMVVFTLMAAVIVLLATVGLW